MTLIISALCEGMAWSVLWIVILLAMFFRYPWLLVHDYPPDARAACRLPEPSPEKKREGNVFTACGWIVLLGTLMAAGLLHYRGAPVSFFTVFLHLWLICLMWNVVDLLVMDWLLFCTLTPKWIVLPGTEGCAGYKDYRFHFVGFLHGCGYMTLFGLVFAGIDYAILYALIW